MQLSKYFAFSPALALALLLSNGCASQPPKKTASQEGVDRWNKARAGVLYSLAKEQFETGNLDDSRKTLSQASKYAPDHVLIRLLSAKVSIEQGQLEPAEAELNRVRELDAKNAEADYLTGVINQRWQKPEVAYQSYLRASEKNPNELAYLLAQAEMLVQLEQTPKALEILRDKLNFFENSPAIRDAVGQLLMQQTEDRSQKTEDRSQNYAEAVAILRQASALAPEEQTIREHYGLALYYNRQYREAASVLERLINQKTEDRSQKSEAKNNYTNRADIRTALGECQMEIDQGSPNPGGWGLGTLRDARDNFEMAAQLEPGTATVWLNLAKVALRLNDLKRAELSLKKAMTIDPKSADANLLMGYLCIQQAEDRSQKTEARSRKLSDALASFRKASTLDQGDAVSVCMTGLVLEKMGRSDEAIR